MNEYKNSSLFFNPHGDIIKNQEKNQVALINPLLNTWIKISCNAYEMIEKLTSSSINGLIEKQEIDEDSKDDFVKLVNYLISNKYLLTKFEYDVFKNVNILEGYQEMVKSVLPEMSKRLYLSLTSSCNLKCIHCYNTVKKPSEYLGEEDQIIYDILEKLKDNYFYEIILTGGEPFLRKDIFEIIEQTIEISKEVTINTNSLLLNKQKIERLKKYKNLTIAVSLDGLTKATHENIRGVNTFEKTLANINALIKNGIKTHIIATVTKKSYKELVGFDDFIKELRTTGNLSFFTPVGKGKESIDNLIMDNNELQEYSNLLFEKHKDKFADQFEKDKNHSIPIKFNCSAGIGILGIEHTGRVVPCHLFLGKDISLGNILSESLVDMQLKWLKNGILSVDSNSECKDCSIRHFCGNGCLANTYYNNGTFNGKDPNCLIHKIGIQSKIWYCEN